MIKIVKHHGELTSPCFLCRVHLKGKCDIVPDSKQPPHIYAYDYATLKCMVSTDGKVILPSEDWVNWSDGCFVFRNWLEYKIQEELETNPKAVRCHYGVVS